MVLFPNEIIFEMASHLTHCTFEQKMNIIIAFLSCTDLTPIIKPGRAITINNEKYLKTIELLSENNRKQVQTLHLSYVGVEMTRVVTIPKLLPNMKYFTWVDYDDSLQEYGANEGNAKYWEVIAKYWEGIVSFRELSSYSLSINILAHGGFRNLAELDVYDAACTSCNALVRQLSNAPKLKILKLGSFYLTLLDLRELHHNAPQLETLNLDDIELQEIEGEPVVADPSSCLKLRELILRVIDHDQNRRLMEYMGRQYKNLKELTIRHLSTTDKAELARMISGYSHLESYRVGSCDITANILGAFDDSGARLKEIEIQGTVKNKAFYQLELLANSNQRHYLEKMNITSFAQDNMSWEDLQKFKKLKHLVISRTIKGGVPLHKLLKTMEHLETLELNGVWVHSDHEKDDFKSNLKTLILTGNYVNTSVMSFLSKACPKLSNLSIEAQNGHLEFPHHRFASIVLNSGIERYCKVENKLKGRIVWGRYNDGSPPFLDFPNALPTTIPNNKRFSVVYASCASLMIGKAYVPDCYL